MSADSTEDRTQMTKALACTCESEYQDKKCGKGLRWHNRTISEGSGKWRCTVCGKLS